MATSLVASQFITNEYGHYREKITTRVFVRQVFTATSGDLKSCHKGWFVAKKAFVMKIFATKTLALVVC